MGCPAYSGNNEHVHATSCLPSCRTTSQSESESQSEPARSRVLTFNLFLPLPLPLSLPIFVRAQLAAEQMQWRWLRVPLPFPSPLPPQGLQKPRTYNICTALYASCTAAQPEAQQITKGQRRPLTARADPGPFLVRSRARPRPRPIVCKYFEARVCSLLSL